MLGRTDSRIRLLFLLVVLILVAVAIVGRLAWWQVVQHDFLAAKAAAQTSMRFEIPSRRGAIYDRSGVVVLATTVDRQRVVAAPEKLTAARRVTVGDRLVQVLELGSADAAALRARLAEQRAYVILARDLPPATAERIRAEMRAGNLPQISLESEPARAYPQPGAGPDSSLAAHLLGFVNREGTGQYGVEQYYQDLLAGRPRVVFAQRDVNSRPVPETMVIREPGVEGVDLRLTIDAGLQMTVEQEVFQAWLADEAASVSAVVMDAYTGEIYASGTYPSYDANAYREVATNSPSRFVDPIVSSVYEPGSVFKLLTALAALETGRLTTSTRLVDTNALALDGGRTRIGNADRKGMGEITLQDAVAYSRNVATTKMALALGKTTRDAAVELYHAWTRLGFGSPTGIDVAGEVAGLVRDPAIRQWREIDLANASFGQGVAVTPLQLAVAYAAMVNGGLLVRPHVVQAIADREVGVASRGEVVDPDLSAKLVRLMNYVITEVPFYRDRTLIPGYYVGGKTGTAQIWDPALNDGKGAWKENVYNYTFVGYVGREEGHPELIVAVRINEARPKIIKVGHLEMPIMSFELFRRIAHNAITTPGLLPERPLPILPPTAER
jgi:cell division protein FtsI (penicillin-binding protein 3)